jgi:aerobic-type carbon monoxide dehydrogenase small subunit (CoxS/CutS family)
MWMIMSATSLLEETPDPSRVAAIREDLLAVQARAEGEATAAIADARERIAQYRATAAE